VRDGGKGRIVKGKRDARNRLDTSEETIHEFFLANIKDLGREHVARVIYLDYGHSVCERGNVQHIEKGGLGWTNTSPRRDDLDIGDNFNGTTGDLCGDTKGLEERCLSWFHARVTSRNVDILGREGTSTGRCSNFVGNDDITDIGEIFRSEDEADVFLHTRQETFEFRKLR